MTQPPRPRPPPTPQRPEDINPLLRRLAGRRVLARLAILFEHVWPAIWPALGVAGVFVCVALLDLPRYLAPGWHLALLIVTATAIGVLLVRGLWSVRTPDDAAADRRLERASGLLHRPLAVLTDRPAQHDPMGVALWQAHLARTIRQVRRLRVGAPHPGLPRRDRYALRAALVVALIAAFGIAGQDAPARLLAALQPTLPRLPEPPATELQAWITPPAYTHLAPVFLKAEGGPGGSSVSVPAGSHLTVSVTGGSGTPSLSLDSHGMAFRALDKGSFQADSDLTQGGRLAVRRNGRELAGWDLAVVVDRPPSVAWAEPPGSAGTSQQTRLPWTVNDDYGVVSLQAELRLKDRPQAPPLVVSIPLPGGTPKAAHGVNQQDLTAHPWAGLPVIARLVGRDAPGQPGTSADATFTLPERPFQNPVARALIAIRKGLSVHPDDRDSAVDALDTSAHAAADFWLAISAPTSTSARCITCWRKTSRSGRWTRRNSRCGSSRCTWRRGRRSKPPVRWTRHGRRHGMRSNKAMKEPTDANRQALEQRLQELQRAIEQHMQALLDEAQRNHEALPFDPNSQHLSNRDFERMAEAAREAAREGRMDEAQQRMAELERMLDQLRNARAEHGQAGQRNAQQRQRGRQQMGALQDMIGRQGGLLDHAQGRADAETRPRFGQRPPTEPTDPNAEREADQRVQQALRRALGELMQQFSDLSGELPPSLGEADKAMREAGRELGTGNDKGAGAQEQKAIEALQKGGQEMGQAMARQFGPGQQGQDGEGDGDSAEGQLMMQEGRGDGSGNGALPGAEGRADGRRDPLGRHYGQGNSGADEGEDVTVPEERERQRTRAIEEELRRRDADRERPQEELDYFGRLLKGF